MITLSILALMVLVGAASLIAFIDCWIRGRYIFTSLKRERALLDAGFVPMINSTEPRLRQPMRFEALATQSRVPTARLSANRQRPSLSRQAHHSERGAA